MTMIHKKLPTSIWNNHYSVGFMLLCVMYVSFETIFVTYMVLRGTHEMSGKYVSNTWQEERIFMHFVCCYYVLLKTIYTTCIHLRHTNIETANIVSLLTFKETCGFKEVAFLMTNKTTWGVFYTWHLLTYALILFTYHYIYHYMHHIWFH